jgi:hypothetical protein
LNTNSKVFYGVVHITCVSCMCGCMITSLAQLVVFFGTCSLRSLYTDRNKKCRLSVELFASIEPFRTIAIESVNGLHSSFIWVQSGSMLPNLPETQTEGRWLTQLFRMSLKLFKAVEPSRKCQINSSCATIPSPPPDIRTDTGSMSPLIP